MIFGNDSVEYNSQLQSLPQPLRSQLLYGKNMNYQMVAGGLPVMDTLNYLEEHPDLWDQITERQDYEGSAHHDTKCIFLRWCAGKDMHSAFYDLEAVDYPAAKDLTPAITPLFNALLCQIPHETIGRVILVSLKPGGSIDEHFDAGDYAERFDRFHVALQSDEGNRFIVGGEQFHAEAGEAFWFNVKRTHLVENRSQRARIHLIVDLVSPAYRRLRGTYFQRERVHSLWPELRPLLKQHWREIAHYDDIPLCPDEVKYEALENANLLRIFTVRIAGDLVGYAVCMVGFALHYASSIQAVHDVLWLKPEHRETSLGWQLLKFYQRELKKEGVQVDAQHVKAKHTKLGRLLEGDGYELVDHVYLKRLDRE